jgi:hypothetical protein
MARASKSFSVSTVLALSLVAVGATACGGTSASVEAAATSTASSPSTTSAATTTVSVYDRWFEAASAYFTPTDTAYQYHLDLCETLRTGGEPAHSTWPAQSPAQVLRDDWGVGQTDPVASMKQKADVAEFVIIPILCPDASQALDDAKAGNFTRAIRTAFGNGKYLVGTDIAPGTYSISSRVEDCYWERSDAQGNIIANNFVTLAPSLTVTIEPTDAGFTSKACGTWTKAE